MGRTSSRNSFAITTAVERSARRKRFALFRSLFLRLNGTNRPLRILDVGGTWDYWREMDWRSLGRIEVTLLNVFPQNGVPYPFTSVLADARDLSSYANSEFDTVYSNSALGHVGTFADQLQAAREIRRVGRSYFVQTPNQHFIIDWRTLVPFFHFLPIPYQAWCFRHFRVGRYQRAPTYSAALHQAMRVRNLTSRELHTLFPDGNLLRERIGGLSKSFMIHAGFEQKRECKPADTMRPSGAPHGMFAPASIRGRRQPLGRQFWKTLACIRTGFGYVTAEDGIEGSPGSRLQVAYGAHEPRK
jgi:hypothetical protein